MKSHFLEVLLVAILDWARDANLEQTRLLTGCLREHVFCLEQEPELPGVIENVTLVNFLCHSHLCVPFGPRVNFITGRNGSKSLKKVYFC